MYGWSRAGLLVAALVAPGSELPPPGSVVHLEVPLPAGWRESSRMVLALEDVTTPRGQPFKVVVRATAPGEPDVALATFGVLADEPGACGVRPPATYRVDVTRGLRRWSHLHPGAKTVNLALATIDGRSKPIVVTWRVGRAHLTTRPDPQTEP